MSDYKTALPMVFELARKVQETGRTNDLSRTFSGTPDEISSYAENIRCATDGLSDAVCAVGHLLIDHGDLDSADVDRIGWLLITLGEMQNVLSGEAFALSERVGR